MTPPLVHIHLVSDSTGETVLHLAKACLVQFDQVHFVEHLWSLVRSVNQVEKVLKAVEESPGLVFYSLIKPDLKKHLIEGCEKLNTPPVGILEPVLESLSSFLKEKPSEQPGRQYVVDDHYLKRLAAIDFTLDHDDGQNMDTLGDADIVLLGVSRTSKTPTSLYLAHHGLKAANIPIVMETPLAESLLRNEKIVLVGLIVDPDRLIRMRHNRTLTKGGESYFYTNPEYVQKEIFYAQKLYRKYNIPTVDITYRSIEETAASVINYYYKRKGLIK
jgi:[pyruvate, water dikinase]-phosphate phosphotransferase / [pyruvate, water dikinase] kinase